MLTLQQVIDGHKSDCIDGRDLGRLFNFMTFEQATKLGGGWSDEEAARKEFNREPRPWTEDEIRKQLADDVAFGFEKALNRRGISAGCMFNVVKMWMWVLDDDLKDFDEDNYAQYGLPLFKAVAVKYGLPNPIGDDTGSEGDKYSVEADWPT